jgi:SnoaL-like domain
MPTLNTVERFVSMVEAGQGVDALVHFYAEHASMQENGSAPRVGKDALLKFEHSAQASVTNLKATCIRPILISGDVAVIRWVFAYTTKTGKTVRFEELAYQRWENELIAQEQFFYDPAQFS